MLLTCLIAAASAGDTSAVASQYSGLAGRIRVEIPRVDAGITVDGVLDEPVWQRAARLTDFSSYAPADGRPADQRTEVLVWYSPGAIHFGVRAWAPAGTVRATLADRDKLTNEDLIEFYLGTSNDGRQAMVFGVNPLGVQQDGSLLEGSATSQWGMTTGTGRESVDLSPDYVYSSRGRLTDDGFEIEVRIPFKSLRYQAADPQDWGLHVIRRTMASGHEDSWVPALRARSSFLAQSGTLQGLTRLHRGLVMDVNPVATARAVGTATEGGDWRYARAVEFGGNLRWGITPTLTLNGTVNPDFSQVESDASQVVTDPREALYFPEKRPFFLEGIEQFSVPNQLIYTRRILAPAAATKLTGTLSGTNVGVLLAADDQALSGSGHDNPLFAIVRVTHDIGEQSRLGLVVTDREDGGSYNRVGGVDARILVGGQYTLTAQGAASATRTGDSVTTAPLWQLGFVRNGRQLGLNYSFRGVSDAFDAAAGFVRRRDIVSLNLQHSLTFYGDAGATLERSTVALYTNGIWRYDDFVHGRGLQDTQLWLSGEFTVKGGWSGTAMFMRESFGYDDRLYQDYAIERHQGPAVVDTVPYTRFANIQNVDLGLWFSTPWLGPVSFHGEGFFGNDVNYSEWSPARIWIVNATAQVRPTAQLRIDGSFILQSYLRRSDWSTVSLTRIPRLRVEYQLSRAVFLRLVGEYSAGVRDSLRDDSRSNDPVLIRGSDGIYRREPALRQEDNQFRGDLLFSYQPTPGTVFFAGYGGAFRDAQAFGFDQLRRQGDGFFLKASYLFRL